LVLVYFGLVGLVSTPVQRSAQMALLVELS
jgi:hypothetical protein